jgi:uncharacterized protein (TIGR04141 family)
MTILEYDLCNITERQVMAKTPIRILLLKDAPEFDEAVDLPTTLEQKDLPNHNAKIFWKTPPSNNTPKWVKNIFPGDRELHNALTTKSIAAVLIIKYREKTFAITFGYGRTLIKQELIEPRFGLKVVLNRVKADSLRSIDTKSLDGFLSHNREQVPVLSPLTSFGIDIEKDFIKAVTGVSSLSTLGETITGTDSFFASLDFSLDSYQPILDGLIVAYEDTSYRTSFEFVDNVEEVVKHKADQLNEQLLERIINDDRERIWLAPPEIVDWENHGGFCFKKTGIVYDDIGLNSYIDEMVSDISTLTVSKLRRDRVLEWTGDDTVANAKWPVYKCLYAEIEDGTKRFILSDGRWFEVNEDFVAKVNDYLDSNLDEWDGPALPDYDAGTMAEPDAEKRRGETQYNYQVAGTQSYTLTDADLIIHGGANSSIELCDLYAPDLYIHVKRYTRSSGLSHLFNQGKVSAELICSDLDFRRKAKQKIESLGGTTNLDDARPDMTAVHIVFGIVSGSKSELRLPFFSRVALKNAVHFLKNTLNVGKVSLTKIQAVND